MFIVSYVINWKNKCTINVVSPLNNACTVPIIALVRKPKVSWGILNLEGIKTVQGIKINISNIYNSSKSLNCSKFLGFNLTYLIKFHPQLPPSNSKLGI